MLFNSFIFIFLFLPVVLLLFYSLAKYSHQLALGMLLLASVIFYGWWDYRYIFPLLFSITVNFFIAYQIQNSKTLALRQYRLWLGIIFNLSLLAYYKYTDFFIQNFNDIFHAHLPILHITLPLGISFFTFTQIAFLVDNYRGLVQKCRPLNFALFVTYFPHLIAGPIIHHKEVMPQFEKNRTFTFNYRNMTIGLSIFAIGLFKKTVMADYLGTLVGPIFDVNLPVISMIDAWISALAYTFEIYFDFSGYSDMAIGLSLLIGIKLPINFYSPYQATNIIEFWRRWNITLSRFLRDYLYIPLGGNRSGRLRRYLNLMVTMLLGGLWHGASWTFVIWGLLHGTYLCLNHAWISLKNAVGLPADSGYIVKIISTAFTFLMVVIAWIFFRAPDFATAHKILTAMFFQKMTLPDIWHLPLAMKIFLQNLGVHWTADPTWVTAPKGLFILVIAALVTWWMPNTYQLFSKYRPAFLPYQYTVKSSQKTFFWKPRLAWDCLIVAVFVFGIMHIHASSIFLYFRF